jgi:hypothetical protein
VISEDVLPREIQIFAPSKEIGQNEDLNTFCREELEMNPKNLKGNVKRVLGGSFCFQS